jgi:hypothetical protein
MIYETIKELIEKEKAIKEVWRKGLIAYISKMK